MVKNIVAQAAGHAHATVVYHPSGCRVAFPYLVESFLLILRMAVAVIASSNADVNSPVVNKPEKSLMPVCGI